MKNSHKAIVFFSIVLISFLMHLKHFPKDLISIHVWRQTQTQSTITNFYEEDMNLFRPRRNDRGNTDGIFRMEFPLMQWIVAGGYHIIPGNQIVITRAFMFLIGLCSVLGMYRLLLYLFGKESLAIIGAWAFNFSPSFYFYTINPLPDNLALCCSIWGLAFFFGWYQKKHLLHLMASGLFISIGALCKLPFLIYFIIPISFFALSIYEKGWDRSYIKDGFAVFSFSLLPLAWYAWVIPQWKGNVIVKGILENEDSFWTTLDNLQHIALSTIPELMLNYGSVLFFLAGFYFLVKNKAYRSPKFWMILSLCFMTLFYYFFEINAIGKIHDYYLFPFFPLLFILVGYGAYHLMQRKYFRGLTFALLLLLPLFCFLRMESRWDEHEPGFNKDLLLYKTELRNAVPKDALVVAGNDLSHFIFLYYIDKKGWGFQNDELTAPLVSAMISEGANYLYTDSDVSKIEGLLEEKIIQKGSISVYSLKQD